MTIFERAKLALIRIFQSALWNEIIDVAAAYLSEAGAAVNGVWLREHIRQVFGTSLSAAQLDEILALARAQNAAANDREEVASA